jgi:GNAT superfamily N-acetyltransferase
MGSAIERYLQRTSPLAGEPKRTQPRDDFSDVTGGGSSSAAVELGLTDHQKARRVLELQRKTDLDFGIIDRNLPDVETQVWRKEFAPAVQMATPAVKGWLDENPYHVAAAGKDLTALSYLERQALFITSKLKGSATQERLRKLNRKDFQGTMTPREMEERDALESMMGEQYTAEDLDVEGFFESMLGEVAGQAGVFASLGTAALQGATVGAATGAAAGPAAPVTVPVAAGIGAAIGVFTDAADQMAMESFRSFSKLRDENGNPLSRTTAQGAAVGVGLIGGALEYFSLGKTADAIPGVRALKRTLSTAAVKRALQSRTAKRAVMDNLGAVATAVVTESATEGMQGAIQDIAGTIESMIQDGSASRIGTIEALGRIFSEDHVESWRQQAVVGAQVGLFTAGAGGVASTTVDVRRAVDAQRNARFFTALGKVASSSEMAKTLPHKLEEVVERMTKDGPVETVYADTQFFTEYWQSQNLDPAEVAATITGDPEAYDEALTTGQLAIPTSKYAAHVAATDHHNAFLENLRFGSPDAMTSKEQREFVAELQEQEETQGGPTLRSFNPVTNDGDNERTRQWLADNPEKITARVKEEVVIDAADLIGLVGERGEQNAIREDNVERLAGRMRESGYDRNQAVAIDVFPDGHAEIYEGNHRIRAAAAAGVPVFAEVRYLGGAELNPDAWKAPSMRVAPSRADEAFTAIAPKIREQIASATSHIRGVTDEYVDAQVEVVQRAFRNMASRPGVKLDQLTRLFGALNIGRGEQTAEGGMAQDAQSGLAKALESLSYARGVKFGFEPEWSSEAPRTTGEPGSTVTERKTLKYSTTRSKKKVEVGVAETTIFDDEGKPVGFFSRLTDGPDAGAFKVVVRPDAQRQGIGMRLIDAAVADGFDPVASIRANSFTADGRALMRAWLERNAPRTFNQSAKIRTGEETLEKFGLDPKRTYTNRQVAYALETWVREKFGRTKRNDYSAKARDRIAQWIAEEVLFELQDPANSGAGWYTWKFQAALDAMAVRHPELGRNEDGTAKDQNARDLLTAVIAVLSDGQEANANFQAALAVYGAWKDTGRFELQAGHQREASHQINLANIQRLYDPANPGAMRETLLETLPVKELRKIAKRTGIDFDVAYESDVTMPMAVIIFGPKLGAFYANLMGQTEYLTMDRWWSRTFNRYRGDILTTISGEGIARVRELIGEPDLSDWEVIAATVAFRNDYAAKGYKDGTELEKAANTVYKAAFEGLEDAPFGAKDRTFMLASVAKAREVLAAQGHDVSPADIQAILWYYEKKLYAQLTRKKGKGTEGISFEEAARNAVGEVDRPAGSVSEVAGVEATVGPELLGESAGVFGSAEDAVASGERTYNQDARLTEVELREFHQSAWPQPQSGASPLEAVVDELTEWQRTNKAERAIAIDTTTGERLFDVQQDLAKNTFDTGTHVDVNAEFPRLLDRPDGSVTVVHTHPAGDDTGFSSGDWMWMGWSQIGRMDVVIEGRVLSVERLPSTAVGSTPRALRERWEQLTDEFTAPGQEWEVAEVIDRANRQVAEEFGFRYSERPTASEVESEELIRTGEITDPLTGETLRTLEQPAYHGSPHHFERFSLQRIGSGEGGAAFGWGLYFAGKKEVAEFYREQLAQPNQYRFSQDNEGALTSIDTMVILTSESPRGRLEEMIAEARETIERANLNLTALPDKLDGARRFQESRIAEANDVIAALERVRDTGDFSTRTGRGRLYTVEIPEDDTMILYDEGILQQPQIVQDLMRDILKDEKYLRPTDNGKRQLSAAFAAFKMAHGSMGREGDGGLIYDTISRRAPADFTERHSREEWASRELAARGISGIKYRDQGSRGGRKAQRTYNYVIFDDALVKILDMEQAQPADDPRGRIRFSEEGINIDLLEQADLSTFVHEMGHFYMETLTQLAPTSEAVKRDLDTLRSWVGAAEGAELNREQHEMIARGFEAYLMEGNAPTPALQGIFSRMKAWMTMAYRSVTALNVTLTDEVRGVFDRLLASEEEIAEAEKGLAPLFEDPAALGMTEAQAENYQSAVNQARESARKDLEQKALADVKRTHTKAWKAAREEVRKDVAAEVNEDRMWRALSVLQRGKLPDGTPLPEGMDPIKLDRQAIIDMYGGDRSVLQSLPRPFIYAASGGLHPDQAAEILGYASGDELLKDLPGPGSETAQARVERLTDERMKAEYGDMLEDGRLAEEAARSVHNEDRSRVLRLELQHLASDRIGALKGMVRKISRRIPSSELLKSEAQSHIAAKKIRAIKPHEYLQGERRAAKAAMEALLRGDIETAFQEKLNEAVNHERYRAAVAAQNETEKATRYLKKFQTKPVRARFGKVGGPFLDQIDSLLERMELSPISANEVDRRTSLVAFMRENPEVEIPEYLIDPLYRMNYMDGTYQQLLDLRDTVVQIAHLVRLKEKLLKSKKIRDIEEATSLIAGEIVAHTSGELPASIETRLPQNEKKRFFQEWFSGHRKYASLLRQMSGFVEGSNIWEMLIRPLNEAATEEATENEKATLALRDLFAPYSARERREMYQVRAVPGTSIQLSKMGRLMIALNWGNETNRQRLMAGYADQGYTEKTFQSILDSLDERDWQFVQGTWDMINGYWPRLEALGKMLYGLPPEKVEPSPFRVNVGGTSMEIRGGYFPIAYDDRQSSMAYKNRQLEMAERVKNGAVIRASTAKGMLKERVEGNVKGELRLDFGVIFEHINEVIHTVTHTAALSDVNTLLGHQTVASAIKAHYGDIVFKELLKTLNDVAAGDLPAANGVEQALGYVRQGATIVGLGLSFTTPLLQPLGLSNSIARIGVRWVGAGIKYWAANPLTAVSKVHAKSDFMRLRHKTMMREINEIRNSIGANGGKLSGWVDEALEHIPSQPTRQGIADSFFWMIGRAQMIADIPTWIGAHEKALEEGADDETAVARADQAVKDSQGGGQAMDLAQFQRGGPALRLFTNFYSYFNVVYNQLAETGARTSAKDPASIGRAAVDFLLIVTVPTVMSMILRDAIKGEDDDDENLAVRLGKEHLAALFGTMLLLREAAGFWQGYNDYSGPAGGRIFGQIGRFVKQAQQGELDEAFFRSLNQAAGILLHYPAGQVDRTVRGIMALKSGDTSNPLSLLFGPPKK